MSGNRRAIVALLLLVPAPSIGVISGMVLFPNSLVGTVIFGASKLWLLGLPLVWLRFVMHEPFSLSPARQGGFALGVLSGTFLSVLILATYAAFGETLIDRRLMVQRVTAIGLGSRNLYLGGALYWILVNSVLEEYVWRWFCVRQCERLMPPLAAVVASALFFTLHHIFAMSVYFRPVTVAICSFGVFTGGIVWSMMYMRYRSIWPGYVSHAIVDLCIFGIGASVLFGSI